MSLTETEALHELSFDHLPVIFDLGDENDTTEIFTRIFTEWEKFGHVSETTLQPFLPLPSTPALLDDTVALF
jgi:hypothetical protein